jgi:hypothetical protein
MSVFFRVEKRRLIALSPGSKCVTIMNTLEYVLIYCVLCNFVTDFSYKEVAIVRLDLNSLFGSVYLATLSFFFLSLFSVSSHCAGSEVKPLTEDRGCDSVPLGQSNRTPHGAVIDEYGAMLE